MTIDFCALCAELLRELEHATHDDYQQDLKDRARAALAEPQPEPPTDEEVTELVAWLRRSAGCADESPKDLRAADLLVGITWRTTSDHLGGIAR